MLRCMKAAGKNGRLCDEKGSSFEHIYRNRSRDQKRRRRGRGREGEREGASVVKVKMQRWRTSEGPHSGAFGCGVSIALR